MKLLLFDIDGTLIRSQGAGRMALQATLEDMFGTAGPIENYHMSGKTDARIVTDLLTAAGLPAAQIEDSLPQIYIRMAEAAQTIFWEQEMVACPGVVPLLTGNSNLTAPLKLEAAGIDPGIFRVGAYGSDALDRNQLPAMAMARAQRLTDVPFTGAETVIIGDTPADILCARAGGATAVAVASGWHAASTLSQYQPDHLLDNLANTEEVLRILLARE